MRTGALGATVSAVIAAVAAACATAPPPAPRAAEFFRSPPLDYRAPGPISSDGEVMGAHQRDVDDTMLAGATSARLAPGWQTQYGQLHFERERARPGYGVIVDPPACYPPAGAGPALATPEEAAPLVEEDALVAVSEDELRERYTVSMARMAAELRREQSNWLRCDNTPTP